MKRPVLRGRLGSTALSLWLAACLSDESTPRIAERGVTAPAVYAVTIAAPDWLNGLNTGVRDQQSDRVSVRCNTCHELLTKPPQLPQTVAGLGGPHRGLKFEHGELRCAACHDDTTVHNLRLADGRSLALTDAMALCSQCHGPQARDYRHGAHGGMRGYWDLSRGPRQRNTCVSCHDPHQPRYPTYMPLPPPRDRFAARAQSPQP